MTPSAVLRTMLARGGLITAPGAYDGLTARLVQAAGFEAVYMTGAGTSAAYGYPDYGLLTMSEMVENAARMSRSVDIPVIADADTGYGNEVNVTRTVREFETRRVAAIHIEDQVSPKRCGHLVGKEVISREEYLAKIRAAVAARRDPDFVLIARTDARSVMGLDEAIARARGALDAGADMAFVEAPETLEEMAAIPARVGGPCLLNMVPGGRTPLVSPEEAEQMGFRLIIHPGLALLAVVAGVDAALVGLKAGGRPQKMDGSTLTAFYERLGSREWDAIRNGSPAVGA